MTGCQLARPSVFRSLMRRSILILLVAAAAVPPSQAARRVTLAQLEQMVSTLHGKPDSEVAFRIADEELTERLSPARIARLSAALPGEKSRQALIAIADASQFQPPPPEETPAIAAPGLAEQRQIMGRVVAYVTKAIPQLPNFIATRTTGRFEDTPQMVRGNLSSIPYEPLHFADRSEVAVGYRENREVEDPAVNEKERAAALERGLSSRGEFGSLLSTILRDAAQNKLEWLRWEPGKSGPLAAFAYSVAKEKSHFEVDFCCVPDSEGRTHPYREVAGYSGNMLADPATGTILRIEVVADLKPGGPIRMAKIAVEYGPVEIGGRTYICPLHSIALSRAHAISREQQEMVSTAPHGQGGLAPVVTGTAPTNTEQTLLNDVTFTQYHVFRAETRIVAGTSADQPVPGAVPPQPLAQDTGGVPPKPDTANAAAVSTPASRAQAKTLGDSAAVLATGCPTGTKPGQAAAPEISLSGRAELPDAPLQPQPAAVSGFRLRTTTRLVGVGIVAYDKKGHPVTDLKQGDFEIYDNGRKQEIKYFGQAGFAPSTTIPSPGTAQPVIEPAQSVYSNRQISPAPQPRTAAPQSHTTILLIDSSHVVFADLAYARSEILRFLKAVPSDEPVGLYILRKYGFEILREPTTGHSEVAAALSKWIPGAQDLLQAQQEELRSRQQMEYVHSSKDLLAMNGNIPTGAGDIDSPPDIQRRSLGDNPEQDALAYLVGVARHLAAFKGHKNLIWVASDNVLADFSEKAPQQEKGDKYLDPLALRARETLNEAQVSIYPLDCSQLEANVVGANLQHANVQVNPTSTDLQNPGKGPDPARVEALQEMEKSKRDINPGRLTAQLQQDTHPIQGTFRELAAATGGRALRRASDIAAELNSIVDDGRAAYLLSFTPDTPADDKYHLVTVKLAGRRDLSMRYRTGYLYEKEPATLKERLRQAIFQPRDLNDIALTATPESPGTAAGLKLTIAATDLQMAQSGDRWTDKLDIFLIERDDDALHAKFTGRTLALNLLSATYQRVLGEGIVVDQPLPTGVTAGSLRILVVDENSRRIGSLTLPSSALRLPGGLHQ